MRALRLMLGLSLILSAGLGLPGCGGAGDGAVGRGPSLPERPSTPLPEGAEAWSFLGNALFPPPLSPASEALRGEALAAAKADLAARPDDPEAWIWAGRQHAYRGAYREAIAVFTEGADRFPDDARFLRHRGHRWLTLRELRRAEQDLSRAAATMGESGAEIEPDGLPNAAGIPLTTLAFNVHYHRALALYLLSNLPA
jgi:tetratricopeptide (TPR) repeat protein